MSTFRTYGPRVRFGGGRVPPGIKALLITFAVVFAVQFLLSRFVQDGGMLMATVFGLVPRGVTHGLRVWQPFTYLFLHGGLWHLLINLLVLWMFGSDLERTWGRRRFLNYFFMCGVGAGLLNVLVKTIADPQGAGSSLIPTIGASGAIYGVLAACAILFPDREIWLIPFPVTLSMRVYVLIMGAIAFFGTLGESGDTVSHVTHLGGMVVGWIYLRRGSFFFGVRNRFLDWKRRRARRRFEVYMRDHRDDPPSRPDRWVN
jgi:membrane associated rhomboid family serine protease